MGAVLHTVNFRLFVDQIVFILNDAEDKVIVVDESLLPLLEQVLPRTPGVRHVLVVGDVPADRRPSTAGRSRATRTPWPRRRPSTPSRSWTNRPPPRCATRPGRPGNPKGVVYSHRAIVLHSLAEALPDVMAIRERDVVMPVVPMFHVNAWGIPFTAAMVGATPGAAGRRPGPADLRPPDRVRARHAQRPASRPSGSASSRRWKQGKHDLSSLQRIIVGGSAAPRAMMERYEQQYGVPVWHAWGMTEMTPLGSICWVKSYLDDAPDGGALANPDQRRGCPRRSSS